MRYRDKILTLPPDNADHALILGLAIHTGIEKGLEQAKHDYLMSYPIITDLHIHEVMKMEHLIPKAVEMLPSGQHEVHIRTTHFQGFIDLICKNPDGTYDMYDFKYSNNVSNYRKSAQLHLYKYFWEKMTGKTIRNMYFLFIPKVQIRQKKSEDLLGFRKRLQQELNKVEPKLVEIEFDYNKVIEFMLKTKTVIEAKEYPKNESHLCNWCEYQDYCLKGNDYMILPKNERRNIEKIDKKVVWLYGSPFSGKTTFANEFPDPLMLNTDGNVKFVDAPFVAIKDQLKVEGRMSKRTLAWQTFKDVIAELEKKDNDFKTIIVDLLEDTYEHCRLYMYDQMGISHESDDSFRAWDKVRTEFLSTLKKLMNLDYENIILISHEDTSKDITKKGGDKITAIKPNLQEKTANKVAGMVDIVARVIADGEVRTLSFKTNEVVFGGGRLTAETTQIGLDYEEFLTVYEEANKAAVAKLKNGKAKKEETETKPSRRSKKDEPIEQPKSVEEVDTPDTEPIVEPELEPEAEPVEEVQEEKPKTRQRRQRKTADDEVAAEPEQVEAEKPKTRTRRKRDE